MEGDEDGAVGGTQDLEDDEADEGEDEEDEVKDEDDDINDLISSGHIKLKVGFKQVMYVSKWVI